MSSSASLGHTEDGASHPSFHFQGWFCLPAYAYLDILIPRRENPTDPAQVRCLALVQSMTAPSHITTMATRVHLF